MDISSAQLAAGCDRSVTRSAPGSVTIVLCTLDDQHFVRDCLDSLVGNPHPALAEVIVVDRGSADATASVVGRFAGSVRLLQRPGLTAEAAELVGRATATADLVVVAPVRAVFASDAVPSLLDGSAERLAPLGTTAFGRAVAATTRAASAPAFAAPGWYFVTDTPGALASRTFASPSPARASLVAGSLLLAIAGRGVARTALPLFHAAWVAARALQAGKAQGVAPHRAFLAGEICEWCSGLGWWAGSRG